MNHVIRSDRFMKQGFPFYIHRTKHDGNHTPQAHSHDFVELVYVSHGKGIHCFDGDQYTIKAGDVYFINPGEMHTYRFESDQQIEIINCLFMPSLIPDTLLKELDITQSMDYFYVHPFLEPKERFNHRLNLKGQECFGVESILENMMKELDHEETGFGVFIRLRMVELLILLSRFYFKRLGNEESLGVSQSDMTYLRISGYLERNYNRRILLFELAELFHMSERHVSRIVKQNTGMSIINVLHQIRVEKAKILLKETDEKIITVAGMVGYEDPTFFCRLFSRIVGCPPSQYRVGLKDSS